MDARRSIIALTVLTTLFLAAAGNAQSPDSKASKKQTVVSPKEMKVVAAAKSKSSESSLKNVAAAPKTSDLKKPEEKPSAKKILTLPQPLLLNLKYDTSSHNPECRCYDFRANLPTNKVVVLNFFSAKKYNVTSPQ